MARLCSLFSRLATPFPARTLLRRTSLTKSLLAIGALCCHVPQTFVRAAEPLRGYHPQVTVAAGTRLDWVFALANQSREQPPAEWLAGYESTSQQYELFVPPSLKSGKAARPAPLVLFISPGAKPAGWSQWEPVCKRAGVIFASPFAAGNDCPMPRRIHIVLDVLDDIRRRQEIDPDRTYLAGFSGGARVATGIAFALPELFGGVVPICGCEALREESWLRQRVVDRLSVALVTGEQDFNRGEVERYRGPLLADVGVRSKVWTVPGLGHGIPDSKVLAEVFAWLEEGASARRATAKKWPAMRIAGSVAPTRAQWSEALLNEAQQRLPDPATTFSGLMQLQGISIRWPDLPAAQTARQTLLEYDARKEHPWEEDDIAEQRRFLLAEGRGLDRYATGPLPAQYAKEKIPTARAALERWKQLLADGPETPAGREAKERIGVLEKIVAEGNGM